MTRRRMIKRRIMAFILMLVFVFNTESLMTLAATSLPNDVFIRQERSDTCTLASATMMLRGKMYLSGDNRWSGITEASVWSAAWTTAGLLFNFTYNVDSTTNMKVTHESAKGISVSRLKQLLDKHPEGIVLYCFASYTDQHAVLLTDYEGDTFFCADPASNYAGSRRTLEQSLLGAKYGNLSGILSKANGVWYIKSSNIIAGNNPEGFLDSAEGGVGKVLVQGWALDRDDPNAKLEYHVYIGGPAGDSNAEAHGGLIADKERVDVDEHPNFYGLGKYHGYADWIETNKRGEQTVYVYAINVGGGNSNTFLGSKTVYISEENKINLEVDEVVFHSNEPYMHFFTYQGEQVTIDGKVWNEEICDLNLHRIKLSSSTYDYLVMNGKKAGTTQVDLYLKNQNGEIVYTKSIKVTVENECVTLNFPQPTIKLDLNKTKTAEAIVDCTDIKANNIDKIELKYDKKLISAGYEYSPDDKKLKLDVKAVKPGTTNLSCKMYDEYGNEVGTGTVKVVVAQPVTGITLGQTSLTMKIADTTTLSATVLPANASNKAISWSSSEKKIATVDANGKVTAVGRGTVTITAKAKDGSGKKATCTITVIKPVEKVTLNKTTLKLKNGASATLKATATPTDADDTSVTWKSSNTKVATVSSKGKVVAVGAGTAKITATAKDGSGKKATCTVTVTEDLSKRFTDVDSEKWYVEGIQFVVDKGIMNGISDTQFAPNKELTRAEFVTVLYNNEGKPDIKFTKKFKDVDKGIWYTKPILWANSKSIVAGYADGTFGPDDKISREQLAVILYKYCSYKGISTARKTGVLKSYSDGSKVSSWAKEAMEWAVSRGVMSGKGNATNKASLQLDPQGNATRAECATMIMKVLDNRMVEVK